jgi:hypothetical protein
VWMSKISLTGNGLPSLSTRSSHSQLDECPPEHSTGASIGLNYKPIMAAWFLAMQDAPSHPASCSYCSVNGATYHSCCGSCQQPGGQGVEILDVHLQKALNNKRVGMADVLSCARSFEEQTHTLKQCADVLSKHYSDGQRPASTSEAETSQRVHGATLLNQTVVDRHVKELQDILHSMQVSLRISLNSATAKNNLIESQA